MAIQQILRQYVLNPVGLIAVLGILPVIIFYLTRPEPERKVMPSMEFFQQDERKGRLRNALRKLQNNILLLINLVFILLLSLGIAGFYLQQQGDERTVIIYDKSVSMQEEHAKAVSTVLSEASTQNTLIVAGENTEVFNNLNRQAAADIVRSQKPIYQQSDMASALQQARLYEGSVLLLSNLDVSDSLKNSYSELGAERGLQQIDYSTENSWGIVDAGKDFLEVRSYMDRQTSFNMNINSETRVVSLRPQETSRVNVSLQQGRNSVELPNDGFSPDNKAYLYLPESERIEVEYRGPENRYLNKAFESITTVEESNDGDLLILNEETESFNSDKPRILMQGSSGVWGVDSGSEQEFSLDSPYNIEGDSEILGINASNSSQSFSSPRNALFQRGNSFYYNIEDEELRDSFVYPVIWRDMIHSLNPPKTFENSNLRVKNSNFTSPGFYSETGINYFGEPGTEFQKVEDDSMSSKIRENQASAIAILLLILLSSETLILLNRGVYR